jgi:hypothetical protein
VNLDPYVAGAVVVLVLAFCLIRRLPSFLIFGAVLVGVSAGVTYRSGSSDQLAEWLLMIAALSAWTVGLAIVRLMLMRSVSLRLLVGLHGRRVVPFDANLRTRLEDLRALRLVRTIDRDNYLTGVGRLLAFVLALVYQAASIT